MTLTTINGGGWQLANHELFAGLDPSALTAVLAECRTIHLPAGATLFHQGDPGDSLYVINRGRLGVRMTLPTGASVELDELTAGVTVGEMALLTGQPRVASVYALDTSELLQLPRSGFDMLASVHPEITQRITQAILPRLFRTQLADVLGDLFGPLDKTTLHELQSALEWQHLAPGDTLFHKGDAGDALYIVVNGRLRAVTPAAQGEQVVGEIGRGECVGEIALLTGEPRMATVYAVRETDVVRLSQPLLNEMLQRHPQALLPITRLIARRAQQPLRKSRPANQATTFALLPISPDLPLADLAQQLVEHLASFGPTLYLDASSFDAAIGRSGAAQTAEADPANLPLLGWLSQQAARYDYIVFAAEPAWSEWTQRCLRQADRLLLVGLAGADAAPGRVETALADKPVKARPELILLHPATAERPTATAAWLAPRQVFTHHHVRLGNPGDTARLARRLTGRAVGLVLGGGGARGHAHIGVIRALEEAGVTIDMIGGTSMGALMGGAYALDHDWQAMARLAADFSSRKQLIDVTLPLVSFTASRKVTHFYQRLFNDVQIEDLWRPFFCISSNMTRAEPFHHTSGPLWEAVRASSAIPGIFAPLPHQSGDLLVDGGVMNNFPLDVMREHYEAGTVIGVSASPLRERSRSYAFGPSVSGWSVLWSRINPWRKSMRVPSLFGSLMRTIELNSVYIARAPSFRNLADIIIQPAVEQFRVLDFDEHAAIIEAGYQSGREQVAAWLHPQEAPATLRERAVEA